MINWPGLCVSVCACMCVCSCCCSSTSLAFSTFHSCSPLLPHHHHHRHHLRFFFFRFFRFVSFASFASSDPCASCALLRSFNDLSPGSKLKIVSEEEGTEQKPITTNRFFIESIRSKSIDRHDTHTHTLTERKIVTG